MLASCNEVLAFFGGTLCLSAGVTITLDGQSGQNKDKCNLNP